MGTALNTIINMGFSIAVSLAIKGITKLANAEKEAREKAVELVESYKSEQQENENLIQQYVQIVSTTTNLVKEKDKLLSIQEKLNENVADQKKKYDLLNVSLAENLKLAREERYLEAKRNRTDLSLDYDKAVKKMAKTQEINITSHLKDWNEAYQNLHARFGDNIVLTKDYNNGPDSISFQRYNKTTGEWETDLRTQVEVLTEVINEYEEWEYKNDSVLKKFLKTREEWEELLTQYKKIVSQVEEDDEIILKFEAEIPQDVQNEFDNIISSIEETRKKISEISENGNDPIALYSANNELKDLVGSLYETAAGYDELKERADLCTDSIDYNFSTSSNSIKDFASVFSEYLDGSFKDTLSNFEKVESAMQTIANGDSLDWETFRELNWGIDVDHILGAFNQVDDGYTKLNGDISDLIALKDKIINQQIQTIQNQISGEEGMTARIAEIQADIEILEGKLSHTQSESDAKYYKGLIAEKKQDIKDINRTISDNNILIKEFKRHLGDTVDHADALKKQLEKLNEQLDEAQKKADAYAEAFTTKIDNVIDRLEEQKDALESQKDTMEEQLDVLESQQETLEETIDNYKKISDVVSSAVDDEIDLLKEQQKAQEDAYNAKIEALKEAHDRQDEENELTEKQVALQEKLRDLERARNTKVLTYSSARGWHFDVDKDAVATAEKAVNEAQKSIDDYTAEQAYKEQIKSIEDERDAVIDSYDAQITAYEEYIKQWEDILDEETKAENERLAMEILGSDWREKIKNKDLQTLNNYRVGYQNYNTQLSNLVNVEIAALKESIKAKEAEIKVIGNHITEWNKYKDAVTKAVNEIKGANQEYAQLMAQIPLDENSSYEQRLNALANFKNQFSVYTDEIAYYASQISNIEASLYVDTNIPQVSQEMANFIDTYRDAIYSMQESLANSATGFGIVNSEWDAKLANAANALRGYSSGGLVDYTGLAMLHGTKQNPEMVLNSQQSQELFKMINGNSFAAAVAAKAADGISQLIKSPVINTTNNSNSPRITIERMDINGVQNPVDFAKQFSRNIEEYWKTKTIENYIKR